VLGSSADSDHLRGRRYRILHVGVCSLGLVLAVVAGVAWCVSVSTQLFLESAAQLARAAGPVRGCWDDPRLGHRQDPEVVRLRVEGPYPREVVSRMLRKQAGAFRSCLAAEVKLPLCIGARYSIERDGSVGDVSRIRSGGRAAGAAFFRCVADALRRTVFPPLDARTVDVTHELGFGVGASGTPLPGVGCSVGLLSPCR